MIGKTSGGVAQNVDAKALWRTCRVEFCDS
jgi:hypothetical protein